MNKFANMIVQLWFLWLFFFFKPSVLTYSLFLPHLVLAFFTPFAFIEETSCSPSYLELLIRQ
jgi:hypothetical protein